MAYTVSSAGPSVCHTLSGGCADTSDTHLRASVMRTSKTPQYPSTLSLTPPEAATVLMEEASFFAEQMRIAIVGRLIRECVQLCTAGFDRAMSRHPFYTLTVVT